MLGPDDLVLCGGTLQFTPLLDRLAPTAEAGFAGLSLFAADCERLAADGVALRDIRRRIDDHGLAITDVEIIGNWLPGRAQPPGMPTWMAELLDRLTPEAMLPIVVELGASVVTVGEMFEVSYDAELMAERFAAICDLYAPHGIDVALEFIVGGGIPSLGKGWEVVRRAGRSNGKLVLDSWHLFRSGSTLEELAQIPGSAIGSVQINDAPARASDDLAREMMRGRLLPGEGGFDVAGVVRTLDAIGSRAPIGVEVFSERLSALPPGEAARECAQAVRALIAQTRSKAQ
ncbi:sugar phosphate isomerase/epimerase family protein [Flavisphingomonas formosensis]|uniref:sugar phosphate isomerase/epimerase family protein n=1 Tax=Flavisphingomonas formosensis TaxID=861534 RepID=UPI0012F7DF62|nr:sugar phosphate isomerase/epimerase [Sphingomonas formosensis]